MSKALPYLDALEDIHSVPPLYHRVEAIAYPMEEPVWLYIFANDGRCNAQSSDAFKQDDGIFLPAETTDGEENAEEVIRNVQKIGSGEAPSGSVWQQKS
jgi:hypothetical protein